MPRGVLLLVFLVVHVCLWTFGNGDECVGWNNATNLTYNVTLMERTNTEKDFFFVSQVDPGPFTTFVNLCANTKEFCPVDTPICQQRTTVSPPTLESWGLLSNTAWYPYNFTTTQDGITVVYSTNSSTGEEERAGAVHILCDRAVNPGIIDHLDADSDPNMIQIFMRSIYGCGYNDSLPYSCVNSTQLMSPICNNNQTALMECLEGDLLLDVKGDQPVYEYSYNSNYLYIDEYYGDDDSVPYGGNYTLRLDMIVESSSANGTYRVPESRVITGDLNWTLSEPQTVIHDELSCTQATTFTLSNTDGPRWSSLAIHHSIPMQGDVSSVTIEIALENYQWYSNQSDYLTFVFSSLATVEGVQPHPGKIAPGRVTNNISFFAMDSTAAIYNDQNTTSSEISMTVLANDIFVSLYRFNGTAVLLGEFGIDVPTPPDDTPASPCDDDDWLCSFEEFTLEYIPTSDNSPTWQFALGELDQNTDTAYVVALASLSEVLQGDDGATQVASSMLSFVNLDRNSSSPEVSYRPDGSAQVSYSTSVTSTRWDSFNIATSVSLKNGTTHFTVTVTISNYVWISSDLLSTLQLELDIGGAGNISLGVDTLSVGPAYVQSDLYASAMSDSRGLQILPVSMSYEDSAFATITHFEGDLTISFLIGLNSTTDQPYFPPMTPVSGTATADAPAGTDRYWIWWVISVCGLLLIGVGIVAAVLLTKRYYEHKNYSVVPDA